MAHIRQMEARDIPEVARMEKETFTMPWSEKSFAEALEREGSLYLVAEENGILGYCGCYVILDEADVNQVAVRADLRGQGLGKELVSEMIRILKERGIDSITLEVRKSNAAAIRLYESVGFVSEGVRKNFYEKPTEDALIMWKRQSVSKG
ncbi:MAG: ribosomal protein S18-alanine N-acetyltransferase [Lachnospiraceae bacterium]|nr:ribosomal protein S18-alanine N-acetyltransferase [Lachnospiraceae bacterium]